MKWLLALIALCGVSASAADISGTWKGSAETPNGTIERTFVFKVDGNKLTGESTSQFSGKSEITDGTVEGDNVSFTLNIKIQDNEMKLKYTGKVNGNEIKFHVESDAGMTLEYNAKKVS